MHHDRRGVGWAKARSAVPTVSRTIFFRFLTAWASANADAHPTKNKNRKRNADRTLFRNLRARARHGPHPYPPPQAGEGTGGGRSPVGVPPRLSPEGLSSQRLNSRPCFLRLGGASDPVRFAQPGATDLALLRGRYPRPPVPVQGCTSQTGRSAGLIDARSRPGGNGDEPPPAGAALALPDGVTG